MVKPVIPAATRTAPEMISIFFSFMGSGRLRCFLHHTWTEGAGFPAFHSKYLEIDYRSAPIGCKIRGRNHIPRLNSPLPNLKLDVPYGEYRATYVKAV